MPILALPVTTPDSATFEVPALVRSSISSVDVFARKERTSAAIGGVRREPKSPSIEFEIGQRSMRFSYVGGNALPQWAKPVFESLASRWGTEHGWDGYKALPTNLSLVVKLMNYLQEAIPAGAKTPIVTPLSDGGVQAEWHKGDTTLEIVVAADEPPRYFFYDCESHSEQDGEFETSVAEIRDFISKF